MSMQLEQVREIANAVLYEGYLLYPYRHSAIKNRQRWTFGVVYPREYSQARGEVEPWTMRTECLAIAQTNAVIEIHLRFLHLLLRGSAESRAREEAEDEKSILQLAGNWQPGSWEEGIEREISTPAFVLADLLSGPLSVIIDFPANRLAEAANAESTDTFCEQKPLSGLATIAVERCVTLNHRDVYKISVQIENRTPGTGSIDDQQAILLQSFISTHTILRIEGGHFISLLDPPTDLADLAQSCQNQHTWPVLVGQAGEDDTLLSSPIILYDYPQIAPESAGALFDGTEIDEILTLRILALTDEEKEQMRRSDARVREILERTEALSAEQLLKLHGTLRNPRTRDQPPAAAHMRDCDEPAGREEARDRSAGSEHEAHIPYAGSDGPPPALLIEDQWVQAGSRVRLHPSARADAFDLLLNDKTARVEVIQQDFEHRLYLVVTLDDDPGREQWDERVLPGHRFFFFPEEIEPLAI